MIKLSSKKLAQNQDAWGKAWTPPAQTPHKPGNGQNPSPIWQKACDAASQAVQAIQELEQCYGDHAPAVAMVPLSEYRAGFQHFVQQAKGYIQDPTGRRGEQWTPEMYAGKPKDFDAVQLHKKYYQPPAL